MPTKMCLFAVPLGWHVLFTNTHTHPQPRFHRTHTHTLAHANDVLFLFFAPFCIFKYLSPTLVYETIIATVGIADENVFKLIRLCAAVVAVIFGGCGGDGDDVISYLFWLLFCPRATQFAIDVFNSKSNN